jgi:hypothetical protein
VITDVDHFWDSDDTNGQIQYITENCFPEDKSERARTRYKHMQELESEQSEAASSRTLTRDPSPAIELETSPAEEENSAFSLCHRYGNCG